MINLVRRSFLSSIGALIAIPAVAKANNGIKRYPTSVFGVHPRHRELDCYHPAFRIGGGERDGQVWYIDCLQCRSAQEAKNVSSVFLAMDLSPFEMATKFKAADSSVKMVDYIAVPYEAI